MNKREPSVSAALCAQRLAEEFGVVGNDAVNTVGCKPIHLGSIVDCPDDDFLPCAFYFADQFGLDQFMLGNYVGDREFGPEAQLSRGLANQAQRDRRVLSVERFDRTR